MPHGSLLRPIEEDVKHFKTDYITDYYIFTTSSVVWPDIRRHAGQLQLYSLIVRSTVNWELWSSNILIGIGGGSVHTCLLSLRCVSVDCFVLCFHSPLRLRFLRRFAPHALVCISTWVAFLYSDSFRRLLIELSTSALQSVSWTYGWRGAFQHFQGSFRKDTLWRHQHFPDLHLKSDVLTDVFVSSAVYQSSALVFNTFGCCKLYLSNHFLSPKSLSIDTIVFSFLISFHFK